MKNNFASKIPRKIIEMLLKHKEVIGVTASIITIVAAIIGVLHWGISKKNNVTITEEVLSKYGCFVKGIKESCEDFSTLDPGYMPRICIDIVNHNNTPLFFDNTDAVSVEVLDYIPYEKLEIYNEAGGANPWIGPVYWNINIDPTIKKYSAVLNGGKDSNFTGDEFLKIDPEDLSRFMIIIYPSEPGYYKLRVNIKYRFGDRIIPYESKDIHYVCRLGTSEIIKRKKKLNIENDSLQLNQRDVSLLKNESIKIDEGYIWLPVSEKEYNSNDNLINERKWFYDDTGSLIEIEKNNPYNSAQCYREVVESVNGAIKHVDEYEDDKLISQIDCQYENDRLVSISESSPEDSNYAEYKHKLAYDDNSNSIIVFTDELTFKSKRTTRFYFDSYSRLVSKECFSSNGQDYSYEYYVDQFGNSFLVSDESKYYINDMGLISKIDIFTDGEKTSEVSFQYNSDGLLETRIDSYYLDGVSGISRITDYEYKRFKRDKITLGTYFFINCFP